MITWMDKLLDGNDDDDNDGDSADGDDEGDGGAMDILACMRMW